MVGNIQYIGFLFGLIPFVIWRSVNRCRISSWICVRIANTISQKGISKAQIIRNILVKHTGQPLEKIIHDTDRDFYMNADAALEYGLIDEILSGPPSEEKKAD